MEQKCLHPWKLLHIFQRYDVILIWIFSHLSQSQELAVNKSHFGPVKSEKRWTRASDVCLWVNHTEHEGHKEEKYGQSPTDLIVPVTTVRLKPMGLCLTFVDVDAKQKH